MTAELSGLHPPPTVVAWRVICSNSRARGGRSGSNPGGTRFHPRSRGRSGQQRARAQLDALAVDDGRAGAAHHVEPLVGALVAVVRPALDLSGAERHLGRLRVLVAEHHAEAVAELKVLVLHGTLL